MEFQSFRVLKDGQNQGRLTRLHLDDLGAGDVVIKAHYSSLNYKDALAVTGLGKIMRAFPMNPGIDVAGEVYQSQHRDFRAGDAVLITGCGLGEVHDGGYSEYLRVPADWLVPMPRSLDMREAMIYGTAGFTAGLSIHRMLQCQQTADQGPIVVTGASGGVGSLAVAMLAKLGFEVIAVSGKQECRSFLMSLGAKDVLSPEALMLGGRPLESIRFGGAIDCVGGALLEGILRHTNLWGNVASVGLAAGHEFKNTVMPFILRGVSLLGISSTNCPHQWRLEVWDKLAGAWRLDSLERFVSRELGLEDLLEASEAMLARQSKTRQLVRLSKF